MYRRRGSNRKRYGRRRVRRTRTRSRRSRSRRSKVVRFVRRGRGIRSSANNGLQLASKVVLHTYHCEADAQSAQSGIASWVNQALVRANSVFDPLWSSTGVFNTYPTFYQYYSNLYNHYKVLSATCVCTLRQKTSDTQTIYTPIRWGVYVNDDSALDGTFDWLSLDTHPQNRSAVIMPRTDLSAKSTIRINFHYKLLGNTDQALIGSDIGSNPNNIMLFMPWIQTLDRWTTSAPTALFQLSMKIVYRTLWTERKDLCNIGAVAPAMKIEQA